MEKVKRFAAPAAVFARVLVQAAKRPGFDPTEEIDRVYFRGTPAK
ncbi:hypothetical protein ACN28S_23915 [Cystobacter fuscus]